MASPKSPNADAAPIDLKDEEHHEDVLSISQHTKSLRSQTRTPEMQEQRQSEDHISVSPGSPEIPSPFDWDRFEEQYEKALHNADDAEKTILAEAESLSKYFRVWTSAASAHDNERAIKRLQTRKRFVNMREENMIDKQQHYEEVVRAFENALALLRS